MNYKYTSGRWIYNEHLRLTERYLEFDVPALKKAITAAYGHSTSDIISFFKLSEGGFNRLFQATFNDGKQIIARIPYPSTGPEHYAVASEVTTLNYLRLHGITTPKVYGWCSTRGNPVGAEYIIMEKLDGTPLGDVWFTMTPKDQHRIMKQIVEWEIRLMSLEFPASGSIYYRKDVLSGEVIPLPDNNHEFCIGPVAHYSWWHEERAVLKIDRGPFIRHPDFQPNNIFVSETNEIVGLVDWQHSAILPLGIAAGIPKHFQNYGDPDSEKLLEPQINHPPNYDSLDLPEQIQVRETIRKRLVHFLYAAFTKRLNEEHYDAIFNQSVILHQRLFKSVGTPWEGDSTTLRADMIRAIQSWSNLLTEDSLERDKRICTVPPLEYPDTVIHDTIHVDMQQRAADTAMEQMRNVLGVDILGWVPNDEYEAVKEMAREMKAKMLEAAETRGDVTGVQNHFPFDDFDETPEIGPVQYTPN